MLTPAPDAGVDYFDLEGQHVQQAISGQRPADTYTLALLLKQLISATRLTHLPVLRQTMAKVTITATAQDFPIPTPPGAKACQVRFEATGSPADNIQGYVNNGIRWDDVGDNSGLAYDPRRANSSSKFGVNGYGGSALRAEEVASLDLSHEGSVLHVASPVVATIAIVNFFG